MAANGNINLVNLDFDSLKESFKTYLRSQKQFNDYNFDGSNISVMLDVMAYNSYLNAFYLNMVGSEMFLDSAQMRESVISHAKELNYIPQSFRSSHAVVNFKITPANSSVTTVTIPRGTSLTSKIGSNTFSYVVQDTIVITEFDANNAFYANNVDVYEGALFTDTYVYNSSRDDQRFVLSNPTIDTDTLRVYVTEDNASESLIFTQANTYLGLTAASRIYFLSAAEQDLYEIKFGNGIKSRAPKDGAVISAVYQVCSGELPNGAALFAPDSSIDGHSNVVVSTVTASYGGAVHETTQSIKTNAPKYYQTQERAVSASDYKTLLQLAFPEIEAINAYGGEQDNPPRYGKVVLSVSIRGATTVSRDKLEIYKAYLNDRSPLTVDPVFVDPEYVDIKLTSVVKYNVNATTASAADIASQVKTRIRLFNEFNLNKFNAVYRHSQLLSDIDEVTGVLSNQTKAYACKTYRHALNSTEPFTIKFRQKLKRHTPAVGKPGYVSEHAITTSEFTLIDPKTNTSVRCELEDDGYGIVNVIGTSSPNHPIVIPAVGTVDYDIGSVTIAKLVITDYEGAGITFNADIDAGDIYGKLNDVLRIPDSSINVTIVGENV
jgi:hypothetical protein